MSTPKAAIVAFAKARTLAKASAALRMEVAPLGVADENQEIEINMAEVRRVLIDTYIKCGASLSGDYDGYKFAERLSDGLETEFFSQLSEREEAGYLYGLALGLALAKRDSR